MPVDFVFDDSKRRFIDDTVSLVKSLSPVDRKRLLSVVFSCIDNTTLNGTDSLRSVGGFCQSTRSMTPVVDGYSLHVASVCVYPLFVSVAKRELSDSHIRVASVAGGFPAGQLPLSLKVDQVSYVVSEGADEVDFVINRGCFLDGNTHALFSEVNEARKACGDNVNLKVILETGELPSPADIYRASMTVLEAGADFIKTSTGKISVGATPEATVAMLTALRDYNSISKKSCGFKVSGGVSSPDDALLYLLMTQKIMGTENISNHIFRIGTSRLTSQLAKLLTE